MAARWLSVAEASKLMGMSAHNARRWLLVLAEEHPKLLDRSCSRKYRVHRKTFEAVWLDPEPRPDARELDVQARADRIERELEWLRADFRRTRKRVEALASA